MQPFPANSTQLTTACAYEVTTYRNISTH